MAVHVLIVDDDAEVRAFLRRILTAEGYEVAQAADAESALRELKAAVPDLVLLDVMLAGEDGRDVLPRLHDVAPVPVILLTALGHESDKILGLKLGADDYVTKPFSPGELVARIQSVLRRSGRAAGAARRRGSVLDFGELVIDPGSREVTVGGRRVEMTAREFDLLLFLASSPRQVFSRDQLLEHVWDSSSSWQDDATVTEHIRRVRRRIEADPLRPRWVKTVRGAGYRFEP